MPAHGNSSLHHPSCAQVQRQHQQVGGSCRFFPASRHSHSPHQRRPRTFNLSTDPGAPYLGFLRMCEMEYLYPLINLPRPHCQCVAASCPSSVAATPKPPLAPVRNRQRHQQSDSSRMMLSYVPAVNASIPWCRQCWTSFFVAGAADPSASTTPSLAWRPVRARPR